MPPDELERLFNEFRMQYEQRHATLTERVVRLETTLTNLPTRQDLYATRQDLYELKNDIASFRESVKAMQTAASGMITAADMEWVKKWLWWGMGILAVAITTIVGALILHLTTK